MKKIGRKEELAEEYQNVIALTKEEDRKKRQHFQIAVSETISDWR